MERLVKNSM